ncbi:MAG: DUF1802 family protein [Chloroherpetonaceae bacterium]|nr:DUF1802 family protein [Chthonomonadaceae bacterium]MDW8209278.1 DUF1802 family protein [Chloroherpetonaceae bacterium]
MQPASNQAFKEWAIACEAMKEGRQILLIRKGGIREEGGVFTVQHREFFLMPTYEHQNARLLQTEWVLRLEALQAQPRDPNHVLIDTCAVVDTVLIARDEEQVNAALGETIWNARYVRERFNFNPYDPLYLLVLRVYNLPQTFTLPVLPEYTGCRSWVTLSQTLPTEGATPAIPDAEFALRRAALLNLLGAPGNAP